MYRYFSILILVISFCSSCGDGGALSKGQSKTLIEKKLVEIQPTEEYWLEFLTWTPEGTEPATSLSEVPQGRKRIYDKEFKLYQKGVIKNLKLKLVGTGDKRSKKNPVVYKAELDSHMSQFIVKDFKRKHPIYNRGETDWNTLRRVEVVLGKIEVTSVDSITKPAESALIGKVVCEANCTAKIVPTAFAEKILSDKAIEKTKKKRLKFQAEFIQYTDGWKLDALRNVTR
jgi:hypothetical protein